ncbi:class I SAM-dependent methyltransferase [Streptomyces sp. NRRL WC-3549]|uniref:class I SAM-dependent methyltransferase n=1 Tax=Streptomyces sp. NRRL WC-3549 TaxID=1463925 RepID=UPI0004C4CFCA|nr:class I SAM-dependent methyltransferase [Streptomyces sp. NRRL WC-3549]
MTEGTRPPAAAAFDAIGAAYEQAFAGSAAHRESLTRLLERLDPRSRVLDVGSGTGRPTAAALADAGHDVLGVDVSPVMVELASRRVPGASFRCADIRALPLEPGALDAVCVYFALLQMSRGEQTRLVHRLAGALRPGGRLVLATVPLDVEEVDAEFMGQRVRVTSFGPEALVALVAGAGLTVEWERHTVFTPDRPGAAPEPQLFLHCTRG